MMKKMMMTTTTTMMMTMMIDDDDDDGDDDDTYSKYIMYIQAAQSGVQSSGSEMKGTTPLKSLAQDKDSLGQRAPAAAVVPR